MCISLPLTIFEISNSTQNAQLISGCAFFHALQFYEYRLKLLSPQRRFRRLRNSRHIRF